MSAPPHPAIKKKRKSQSSRKRKSITPRKSFNHPKIASTIMKKPQSPHLKIPNFSKNPNCIGKVFNSFEVTRPIKPSPMRKSQFLKIEPPIESFNLPMHIKIEINHRENISPPPPRNLSNPLNKLNTKKMIPTPPEKIPKTLLTASPHLQKI